MEIPSVCNATRGSRKTTSSEDCEIFEFMLSQQGTSKLGSRYSIFGLFASDSRQHILPEVEQGRYISSNQSL